MKLTHKKLRQMVQTLFDKVELKLIAIDSFATRYTNSQYEGGASKINIIAAPREYQANPDAN